MPLSTAQTELAAELIDVSLQLGERWILEKVSFTIPAREITAIVGPNGCGKSTLARMLSGYLYPTTGAARILSHRLGEVNVHALRERVKLVQPTVVHEPDPRHTVRDVILTGAFGTIDLHDRPTAQDQARADELIDLLRLHRVAASLFRTSSSGERMRTQLARSLMSRPALLLLDEPTSGLDLPMREQLLSTLEAIHASADAPAIVLVTHHLEEIPVAARHAVLMSNARVVHVGTPVEVFTSERMSHAFAFPIDVTQREGRFFAHVATGAATSLT